MNKSEIFEAAERKYGEQAQIHVAIEEFCEAAAALSRWSIGKGEDEDVISELADVEIMSEQLRNYFGPERVDEQKVYKLCRLATSIGPEWFKKPVAPETESP